MFERWNLPMLKCVCAQQIVKLKIIEMVKQLEYDCAVSFMAPRFCFLWYLFEWKEKNVQEPTDNNIEALMDWKKYFRPKIQRNWREKERRREKGHFRNGWTAIEKCSVEGFFSMPKWVFSEWVFIFLVFLRTQNKTKNNNRKTVKLYSL